MAETADTISITDSAPQSECESSTVLPARADRRSEEDADLKKELAEEKKPGVISLRIWPPTQKTRDAVLNRLMETLSTESVLSKRYGTINSEEAADVAKSIEEEAHGVASSAVSSDDDGIKILEIYSKEISKRMLEAVKERSTATAGNGTDSTNKSVEDATVASKDDAFTESAKTED